MSNKPTLVELKVMMSPADYDDVVWYAKKKGENLGEYVRKALKLSLPGNVKSLRDGEETRSEVAVRLEKLLEVRDRLEDDGEMPALEPHVPEPMGLVAETAPPKLETQLPPEVVAAQELAKKSPKEAPKRPPHSCAHCLAERSLQGASSFGTCNAPEQRGRPCAFPSGAAPNCLYYAARVHRAPGSVATSPYARRGW